MSCKEYHRQAVVVSGLVMERKVEWTCGPFDLVSFPSIGQESVPLIILHIY